ncbi:MAG: hypothetical protein R3B99_16060 [Polyangiales bacterium]
MSDEEQQPPPKRAGNVTMQIDAFRDQVELYDADEGDVEDSPRSVAPPPLPPRTLEATTPAPEGAAPAPTKPPIATIAIGVVVAAVAVGAALWVRHARRRAPPSPEEAPAMEIGPIEIDTQAPPTGE